MNKGELIRKFFKFAFVGATGILVNSAILFILYKYLNIPLLIASAMAVEAAIASNYYWNNQWTFKEKSVSLPRFVKFNLVSLGGLVITTGVLFILVQYAGIYFMLANLVGISLATLWNFGLNLIWTWGNK